VPKFNARERTLIKDIVALLTIKRLPDTEIIAEVKRQTSQTITKQTICNIRQRIKRDSYHWYKTMGEGQYEYIHEFKERIS
jgi:nicotinic acid mononucleotide adenylyltransferase